MLQLQQKHSNQSVYNLKLQRSSLISMEHYVMTLPTTSQTGKEMLCEWFYWEEKKTKKKQTLCVQNVWFWLLCVSEKKEKGEDMKTGTVAAVCQLENVHEGSNHTTNRKNNNISCSQMLWHSGRRTSADICQTRIITGKHISWSLVALFVSLVAAVVLFWFSFSFLILKEARSLYSQRLKVHSGAQDGI